MRPLRLCAWCACVLSMFAFVSCREPISRARNDTPTQVTVWTGRPGNLAAWGHGPDYIYGLLGMPNNVKERVLVLWQWQDDSLHELSASRLPWSMDVIRAADGICGLSLGREKGNWPYALVILDSAKVLKQWDTPQGWTIFNAGGSMNGKFIALFVEDGVDAPGYKFQRGRARVAVIDVSKKERRWVADLNGHGAATVRRLVVSDDGRYIAVAGWNNGMAMVDAKDARVLWTERPGDELSTGYAAFAPNGELIYTAGSEGCVYGIEVATGAVVSQRWATEEGESVYGRRVSSLAISNDGKWLAAGTGPEGNVYVWNLEDDSPAGLLRHGEGTILIVAFSPDAKNIVAVGGGTLKVWPVKPAK